jgi:hypothetical protein
MKNSDVAQNAGRMAHVQGQTQGRHVVAVATQDFFCQRQKHTFFRLCMGAVARYQGLQIGGVQMGFLAFGHFFEGRLKGFPQMFQNAVFLHQVFNQLRHSQSFFAHRGTVQNRWEQLAFFFLVMRQHATMKKIDRLRGYFLGQHGWTQQGGQLGQPFKMMQDANVTLVEIGQR